ncbi:MAG: hypothetical protein M1812_004093 [Candelaria pacifica]|nr:MAG: hypothetical protein M1812_004093 [Candelaria pacifica]
MTSMAAKFIAKKVLGESAANKFGTEDPYFEQVPATRLDGRPTKKTKKRRKALPPGISEHDGKVLTKVKRRAYRLDNSLFNCCGIRFGWSSVIGLVPAIGDIIDAFMAVMVIRTCNQIEGGMPKTLKNEMYMNATIDFFIGLVPFLGDVADAVFRCNTKNAVALEKHLRREGQKHLERQGRPSPAIDPSLGDEFDRDDFEHSPPPRYTTDEVRHAHSRDEPTRPGAARVPKETRGGVRDWIPGGARRDRERDVESGEGRTPRETVGSKKQRDRHRRVNDYRGT